MKNVTKRIRGRISESNWIRLTAAAKSKNNSISNIMDRSLSAFFSYEIDDNRDTRILQRIDSMSRHQHAVQRDIALQTESFFLFMQYFFTMAPTISENAKDARIIQGLSDLNQFVDRLSKRMKDGRGSLKEALPDYTATPDDFYTLEDLSKLGKVSQRSKTIGDGDE